MEITVSFFILLVCVAFFCEMINASMGMGYCTILAPVLIIMGFEPLVAVPAILISQAFGGFSASVFHHHFKNVSFNYDSQDLKIVFIITSFGILASVFAALISLNIPKIVLNSYIGVLVFIMGVIILLNKRFTFSWRRMMFIGVLSAFNKGMSGGGFGPVVTAGQVMAGQKHKAAIGATTLAESPICIVSFLTYLIGLSARDFQGSLMAMPIKDFLHMIFVSSGLNWELILALLIGSLAVGPFGPFITKQLNEKYIHILLGCLIVVLGSWTLIKTYW